MLSFLILQAPTISHGPALVLVHFGEGEWHGLRSNKVLAESCGIPSIRGSALVLVHYGEGEWRKPRTASEHVFVHCHIKPSLPSHSRVYCPLKAKEVL